MIPALTRFGRLAILKGSVLLSSLPLVAAFPCPAVNYVRSDVVPPAPTREFRGVWIATVANIDWPSKPGLSAADQKRELIAILDRAAQLRLNAVILQVRPACDAFYASAIEPWSEYLTGTMGKAPSPFYDPLAFAVKEAHQRGLELHAWFNPYRALHFTGKSPVAANHVSRTRPELVRRVGRYLWLDPGQPAVRDYTLSVVLDVVKRYDIDGVHFDDYFYPDPADGNGDTEFADAATWQKAAVNGRINRDDWRRNNVNLFIERVHQSVGAAKPWVKFGVSPHGVWRPGYPAAIKGMDTYGTIYADSRKWLMNGWVDYFSPQLYWQIQPREQSFPALLEWWAQQNVMGRHLWPGLNVSRADKWDADEIPRQIGITRRKEGVDGYILYNAGSLVRNRTLGAELQSRLNAEPALVPASSWRSPGKPARPAYYVSGLHSGNLRLMLGKPSQEGQTRWWLLQTRTNGEWTTEILPGTAQAKSFGETQPEVIALTAIDRFGAASPAVVLEQKTSPPRKVNSGASAGQPKR